MYVCSYCEQEVKEGTIHHCPGADAEREARKLSGEEEPLKGSLDISLPDNLLPMSPKDGPPLPRMLALRWPWKK